MLTTKSLKQFKTVPNQLTGLRLLLIPVLWVFAVMNLSFFIGLGLIVAGLTDFLDGFMARRLNQVTAFGSQLDSIADNLLFQSVIVWVLILRLEIITNNLIVVLVAILLNVSSLLLGWLKFRRFANLHLYSGKVAALAVYIFLVHAFLFSYHQGLFYIAIGPYILSSIETLILQFRKSSIDARIGSIVLKHSASIKVRESRPKIS